MTELFSEWKIRELHQAFTSVDGSSHKGVIDSRRLGIVMRRLGHLVTDEEAEALMDEVTDLPGEITFSDFLTLMATKMKQVNTEDVIQEAFDVLDADGDGEIKVEELERSLTRLGNRLTSREYKEMVTVMGLGEDDQVSFKNFRNIIAD
nr:calmodulin [Halyomorpha halys]